MGIELTAKGLIYRRARLSKRNYKLMGCTYEKNLSTVIDGCTAVVCVQYW